MEKGMISFPFFSDEFGGMFADDVLTVEIIKLVRKARPQLLLQVLCNPILTTSFLNQAHLNRIIS